MYFAMMLSRRLSPEMLSSFSHVLYSKKRVLRLLKKAGIDTGFDVNFRPRFYIENDLSMTIGNSVFFNVGLTVIGKGAVLFGNNVMVGPNVTISTSTHSVNLVCGKRSAAIHGEVVIESDVWIGAGVVICPGVRIGKGSVIGAGSVVTKDIPENVLAVGTPCVVKREINRFESMVL